MDEEKKTVELETKNSDGIEFFELTREHMEKAQTYMPLESKIELANFIANLCLRPMPIANAEIFKEDEVYVPQLVEEDLAVKNIVMTSILLSHYFFIDMELNGEMEGSDAFALYDKYAGGHLLNQIERFKSDKELKNKAFDIAEDWREFKKIVDTKIYNVKQNANDPLARMATLITLLGTPENLKLAIDSFKATTEGTKEQIAKMTGDSQQDYGETIAKELAKKPKE